MNQFDGGLFPKRGFDHYAGVYDQFAQIQALAAFDLATMVKMHRPFSTSSSILELGAGTGLLTGHLLSIFPNSKVIATDIAPRMLDILEQKYGHNEQLETILMDANQLHGDFDDVGCIVCGFTLQWLIDPVNSIYQWMNFIHSDGLIFVSWLGKGSFLEWKVMAEKAGVNYTGNTLPGSEIVEQIRMKAGVEIIAYEVKEKQLEFNSALSFFRSIRNIGASNEILPGDERRNLLRLCRFWDQQTSEKVSVLHELHYLVLKKSTHNRL